MRTVAQTNTHLKGDFMGNDFDFGAAFRHLRAQGQPPNVAMRNALRAGGKTLRGFAAEKGVSKEWLDRVIDSHPESESSDRLRADLCEFFGLPEDVLWPSQEAA